MSKLQVWADPLFPEADHRKLTPAPEDWNPQDWLTEPCPHYLSQSQAIALQELRNSYENLLPRAWCPQNDFNCHDC
jgi:hypothetical protein